MIWWLIKITESYILKKVKFKDVKYTSMKLLKKTEASLKVFLNFLFQFQKQLIRINKTHINTSSLIIFYEWKGILKPNNLRTIILYSAVPLWLSWLRIGLQCRKPGLDTWVGKIPWGRERLPTPVFWPGEFHGLKSPWGRKELDTTEWLSLHFTSHPILCRFRKVNREKLYFQ